MEDSKRDGPLICFGCYSPSETRTLREGLLRVMS